MKAVFTTKFGPPEVLEIREVDKPYPKQNEILIKVKAIAVTSGDCRMRALNPPYRLYRFPMMLMLGVNKPKCPIQGLWFSGVVESVGSEVNNFKLGQEVYARTLDYKFGANAEYVSLPETALIGLKPKNLSHEEAVSIPFGGLTALYFLRKNGIKKGVKVLIYGASGAVGSSAVQLAKIYGAEVTAVCSSENIEWVKNLGADKVIDYKKEELTSFNDKYDIVFDAVGKLSRKQSKKLAKSCYASVISSGHAQGGIDELNLLTSLAESNVLKPIIDKCFPFEDIIEAHRYVDTGRKKGNVVITLSHSE